MRKIEDLKKKLDRYYGRELPMTLTEAGGYEYDMLREIYNYMVKYRTKVDEDQLRIGVENALSWMVKGN